MIHVQIWEAAGNARITDMTNAGKRGKACKTLTIQGENSSYWNMNEQQRKAIDYTNKIMATIKTLGNTLFEEVFDSVIALVEAARLDGVCENWLSIHTGEIKGIDAPKPKLIVENDNFSACADESGITINDKRDRNNEPSMITRSTQTNNAAYGIAAKVWDKVKQAKTFSEAGTVLSSAGAHLHYYCRMD